MRPSSLHSMRSATATLLVVVGFPIVSSAQQATVRIEENFRAEPDGSILGTLEPGTPLAVESRQGGWTEVTVTGYVYIPSLQVWTEGGFELVVSAEEGENLRAEPAGPVLGRLTRGALLEEVRRLPGWIEVRRTGWIWTGSIDGGGTVAAEPAPAPVPTTLPPSAPVASQAPEVVRAGPGASPLLTGPGGDTLAALGRGTPLEVLARDGDWARVRLEGWVSLPGLAAEPAASDPDGARSAIVSVADLIRDPASYEGRVVEISLQFVSLERADQIRTDFDEGEPFLLTRSPDGQRTFVYVAVPPGSLSDAEGLSPLEMIRVTGRVRDGASTLTANPIIDMISVSIER